MDPRSLRVGIKYEAVDATKVFSSCMSSFAYTDEAHGNSDRISIQCDNIDGRWGNSWYPNPYDRIEPSLIYASGYSPDTVYPCGVFYVDDVSLAWPARTIDFEAVSKPIRQDFSVTKKSKVWSAVSLLKIAQEISGKAGLSLVFDADDDYIETVEQSKQTDSDFIKTLCDDYGKRMKVYSDKLIIYDIERYEKKASVLTIYDHMCTSVQWQSSAQGTYTGARLAYTNSSKNQVIDVSVGSAERLLTINESVDSEAEAIKKAIARLNDANREAAKVSLSLTAPYFIPASSVIELSLFGGHVDGRYFVTKVSFKINGGSIGESLEGYKIPETIG